MMKWWLCLLLLISFPAWSRDVLVGWDNPSTIGEVDWYELQWRNPTNWNQVTIQNPLKSVAEIETSRRYLMRNVIAGALEIWCRSCRDRISGEETNCTSPLVAGWTTGCCTSWTTLAVTLPSQPTKPTITP